MVIIGIDPGKTGAIAALTYDKEWKLASASLHNMPIIDNDYNEAEIANILSILSTQEHHVFVEKVHAMPGQGVTSMFNFGKGYGIIRGILSALYMVRTFITPQSWKKMLMDGIKDKDASRGRAIELFPSLSRELCRKKDIGRADALLIAEYGRRSCFSK